MSKRIKLAWLYDRKDQTLEGEVVERSVLSVPMKESKITDFWGNSSTPQQLHLVKRLKLLSSKVQGPLITPKTDL